MIKQFPCAHACFTRNTWSLGRTLAFSVMKEQFIQVLHTGRGHWLTISNIGCATDEVDVFDSMPPAVNASLKNQIASLLTSKGKNIVLRYMSHDLFSVFMANLYIMLFRADRQCQQQHESSDCGLFALAFASVLASGSHPSGYRFQQKLLRHHLHMCLEQNTFQGFPITRLGRVNMKAIKYSYSIAIYCYCRMPETFAKTMNKCDRCSKWFHLDVCVDTNFLNKWFCENCI